LKFPILQTLINQGFTAPKNMIKLVFHSKCKGGFKMKLKCDDCKKIFVGNKLMLKLGICPECGVSKVNDKPVLNIIKTN